jgi:hypothetical protein
MNPLILGPVLEVGSKLIERFFPDKEKAAEAEREFLKMAVNGELAQVMGQLEINAKEAQHASVFVAGWRPAFGWAGVCGFLYSVIAQPLLAWYGTNYGWTPPPEVNIELLWVVITGMLGIGGLRTWEKKAGVAK